jgi:serine/threonine-protein kinase HipA
VYEDVTGEARLAPVYDLVTTSVYIPQDRMALTLNGTNQWPTAKELIRFGEGRSLGTRRTLAEILERIRDAVSDVSKDLLAYGKAHAEFAAIGEQMLKQWELGRQSLNTGA